MPDRQRQLRQWVAGHLGSALAVDEWQLLKGDASSRQYFRVALAADVAGSSVAGASLAAEGSLIVMDSPPGENLQAFIDVDNRLCAAGLRAPHVYAADGDNGFLLLEDFADDILRNYLAEEAGDALFEKLLPVLADMALLVNCQGLPDYSVALLQQELDLFPDWYLQRHIDKPFSNDELLLWRELCALLIESASRQPQVFVHRDFHSCNLHALADGGVGIIDFQDAVRGPLSYDLASWLWDRYIAWPRNKQLQWMEQMRQALLTHSAASSLQGFAALSPAEWTTCCDFMGLQRNLKIVGIFARLNYRDNKPAYLEMIPQFSAYVLDILPRYPQLEKFRTLLESRL